MKERINFLKIALSDWKVGAVRMTSRYSAERISRLIPKGANLILEYGPGQGVLTRFLLQRLSPTGRLIVIEPNKIIKSIKSILRRDGSFVIFQYSSRICSVLKNYFDDISTSIELRNLPPGFIMHARKPVSL